ncbi:MerR family transcriptional regulator [Changpingibacter yushuensis]|uniref:MerR family transcriptional regulator n=1 Tax=Changpingibacter yushuensis TaxID=2758440 RepID=UPI0015F5A66C|nr:MerR family transcriptional regulator [Changpingibacter yushuensis]MBX3194884.1 MerR family transcriptional regulator [Microbacteriaceae bacterium]
MQEWAIRDVARATGLTSRTLRHYEQIGLLHPSRVASNGYRFYGEAELSRLYRILSLRALELPLATIQIALDDDESLEEAIQSHLSLLEERRDRTIQQITVVQQTLHAVQKGQDMTINEVFAGVDQSQYEGEVRQRWGDDAWERSAKRREGMNEAQRNADDAKSLDVNAALRSAAESGIATDSDSFQALVADHYAWVTDYWGGRKPDRDAYIGLSELYVMDVRFAATYGGQANAEIIRAAMRTWIEANLA